ncbi:larval cuticle protein A2B [Teleopsis dalmanni]|uniref:larval cuticle protein A2B n=1 Tax=Teleopsis dalmanni TaxID=139649 RepID=UPI0018CF7DCE|nr:larval cuticle protein A2B [Teleopsis dalmanni]
MKIISFALVFGCLIASINAGILAHPVAELIEDNQPQYEFHYSVHDIHTGDVKDQFEHRRGEYVTGRYSLIEPDGQRRVVDYSSDPLLGFTAQVRREAPEIHGLLVAAHPAVSGSKVIEQWPAPAHRR